MSNAKPAGASTRRRILACLADRPSGATTPEIADACGRDLKLVRNHLYALESSGRVTSLTTGSGNTKRITWGLPGTTIKPPPYVGLNGKRLAQEIEDEAWPQRSHAPVGTWRIDHPTTARSVFEMGAA